MTARWLAAVTTIMSLRFVRELPRSSTSCSRQGTCSWRYTHGVSSRCSLSQFFWWPKSLFMIVALRRSASSHVVGLHAAAIAVALSAEALFRYVRSYA